MASSLFRESARTKEVGVVDLFAKIAIGASGAPTLNVAASKGVASVSRSTNGEYLVTLSEKYPALLHVQGMQVGAADDITFQVKEEAVLTAGTLSVFTKAAATATDPDDGTTLLLRITLKNSSV